VGVCVEDGEGEADEVAIGEDEENGDIDGVTVGLGLVVRAGEADGEGGRDEEGDTESRS